MPGSYSKRELILSKASTTTVFVVEKGQVRAYVKTTKTRFDTSLVC